MKEYQEALERLKTAEKYYLYNRYFKHIKNINAVDVPNSDLLQQALNELEQYKKLEQSLGIGIVELINSLDDKIILSKEKANNFVDYLKEIQERHCVDFLLFGIMKNIINEFEKIKENKNV